MAAPVPARPSKSFSWADDAIEDSQEYERARSASSSPDSTLSWSYEDVRVSDCRCSTIRRQCTDLSKTPEQETPTSSPPRLINADGVLVDHELLALSFEEDITDQPRPKYPEQIEITPTELSSTFSDHYQDEVTNYEDGHESPDYDHNDDDIEIENCLLESSHYQEEQYESEEDARISAIWARFEAGTPSEYHVGPQYTVEMLEHVYDDYKNDG